MEDDLPTFSSEARWLAPFVAVVLLFFGLAFGKGMMLGIDAIAVMARYAVKIMIVAPVVIIVGLTAFTVLCAIRGERHPISATVRMTKRCFQESYVVATSAGVAVLLIPVLMSAFGLMKMTMPLTVPFHMDDSLAKLDRILFFGIDPWRITYAVLGAGTPSMVLDRLYSL